MDEKRESVTTIMWNASQVTTPKTPVPELYLKARNTTILTHYLNRLRVRCFASLIAVLTDPRTTRESFCRPVRLRQTPRPQSRAAAFATT